MGRGARRHYFLEVSMGIFCSPHSFSLTLVASQRNAISKGEGTF